MTSSNRLIACLVSVVAFTVPPHAMGDAVQAQQSDQFVDSIGVAVHLNDDPELSYWSTLEPMLTALGVRHIRDGVYSSTADPEFVELAQNHGIKATMVLGYKTNVGVLDPTTIPTWLSFLQNTTYSQYSNAAFLSAVEAIEGPNEYDLECPGGINNDKNWVNELTTYQQTQYNDIKANSAFNGVTVVGPAMGQPLNQTALPNMSGMVDTGNDHPYPGVGDVGYSRLDDFLADSQTTWPSLPLEVTEDGYETNPNSDSGAVTQAYQGIMEPHISLENFRRGVQRTFLYDLVDEGTSTDTNGSHHFGLIQNNGTTFTAKPAYASIQNLISILKDSGSSFNPGALAFNLSGTTADVHTLLLEKRDGQYYLVIWLETDNTSLSQSVTVTFDDWMNSSAHTYSPCTSSSATAVTLSGNAVTLNVTAQPTILQIAPAAANGSLLIDQLSDLSETNTSLDWKTLAASPTQWLGRTTEAERTAPNGSNYLTYASVDIRNLTALVGFGLGTGDPDTVIYGPSNPKGYDFSKVQLSASPDGATWTSVPTYVGEVDKAAAHDAVASARWLVPVSPSGPLPVGTNYVKFVVSSTDTVTLPQLFQVNIRQSGVLEAESMSLTASGATTTVQTDPNASGGEYVILNATGTGQYMQFTTPALPAGTYEYAMRYVKETNNGEVQCSIDGTNISGAFGENGTAGAYNETNRAPITFTTAGAHTLKFTVVGTLSSGYPINLDRVVFTQTSP